MTKKLKKSSLVCLSALLALGLISPSSVSAKHTHSYHHTRTERVRKHKSTKRASYRTRVIRIAQHDFNKDNGNFDLDFSSDLLTAHPKYYQSARFRNIYFNEWYKLSKSKKFNPQDYDPNVPKTIKMVSKFYPHYLKMNKTEQKIVDEASNPDYDGSVDSIFKYHKNYARAFEIGNLLLSDTTNDSQNNSLKPNFEVIDIYYQAGGKVPLRYLASPRTVKVYRAVVKAYDTIINNAYTERQAHQYKSHDIKALHLNKTETKQYDHLFHQMFNEEDQLNSYFNKFGKPKFAKYPLRHYKHHKAIYIDDEMDYGLDYMLGYKRVVPNGYLFYNTVNKNTKPFIKHFSKYYQDNEDLEDYYSSGLDKSGRATLKSAKNWAKGHTIRNIKGTGENYASWQSITNNKNHYHMIYVQPAPIYSYLHNIK